MTRPLRIASIGHSYVVGVNRAVMSQIGRRPGIDLTVIAPKFFYGDLRPVHLESTGDEGFQLKGLDVRLSKHIHFFYYKKMSSVITPGAFDIVHAWEEPYVYAGFQVARAASRAGSRYMFRTAQSIPKAYPPPFRQFENFCASHASGWIAGGSLVHNALRNGRPNYPALSQVITLAVEENEFRPDEADGIALRRQLKLEGPVIGFIGRLTAAKGLDVLMKALDSVPAPWTLLALGSGEYEAKLKEWATAKGLGDRVRVMIVKHEEMPRYLRVMDMLVAPSQTTPRWKEQFGRMLIEGFATAIPVIGSTSGEIPFVIADAGMVVDEADAKGWSEAIQTLLNSPEKRKELGQAGLERFHANYTAARVADRYISFYGRLMDVPNGASPVH
jgi:glycosyltransferase involved in cell wall biosynthesis